MTDRNVNEIAVEAIERKLVDAKREARDYEARGLPIPDHVTRKIANLKGAATALRGRVVGEVR